MRELSFWEHSSRRENTHPRTSLGEIRNERDGTDTACHGWTQLLLHSIKWAISAHS